jgi:hypothetical protein
MHPNTYLDEIWRGEEVNEVFVAMSFHEDFDERFNQVFKPAIESVLFDSIHLRANRVDERKSGDSIITEILRGISQARIVLADVSDMSPGTHARGVHRNGNVMYELGLAHAVKSPAQVVIVRDDRAKLMFDISSIPHTTLDFGDPYAAKLVVAELIADRLRECSSVTDIKLRGFLATMTPGELELIERLAECPVGKAMRLDVEVGGRRLTPIPTNTALIGVRSTSLVHATHVEDCPAPIYALTDRGRRLCSLLNIRLAVSDHG